MMTLTIQNVIVTLFLIPSSRCDFEAPDVEASRPSVSAASSSSSSYSPLSEYDQGNIANDSDLVISDEKRLTRDLMRVYSLVGKGGRPVRNTSTPTVVVLGLGLIQLEMDERDKILVTSMWVKMSWKDEYLTWNPDKYGGVDKIRVRDGDIWIPDVMLVNTAEPKFEIRNNLLVVDPEGNVTWVSHQIFRSSCAPDVSYFPFDRQKCHLLFSSWTHMSDEIVLELEPRGLDIGTFQADFSESCKWDVTSVGAQCILPPGTNQQFGISFEIDFKRKTMFSSYILTLPCVFLATLTLVVFWLPPERPDRTTLAMSIFASFLFLLLILVETAPPTAASVPKLAFYYCFNMVIIIVSIFLSSFVVNIYKAAADARHPVPRWLNVVVLRCLSRVVCVHVGGHCSSSSNRGQRSSVPLSPLLSPTSEAQYTSNCRDEKHLPSTDHLMSVDIPNITPRTTTPPTSVKPSDHHHHQGSGVMPAVVGGQQELASLQYLLLQIEGKLVDVLMCLESVVSSNKRKQERDAESRRIVGEWKMVAVVLDRFFFHTYFVLIVLSLVLLFPRPNDS